MSRRKVITAGDVAIDRATVASFTKETWPDDCPHCGARMTFHFRDEDDVTPVRMCTCGTTVHREAGRFVVTPAPERTPAELEIARNLNTTPDNVRVLFSIEPQN